MGEIALYEEFKLKQNFQHKHSKWVSSLIEINSIRLASSSWDETIIIWLKNTKNNSFEYEKTLRQHFYSVWHLVNIPNDDEYLFASCSEDKRLIVWNNQFKPKQLFQHNSFSLICLLFQQEASELICFSGVDCKFSD